MKSKFDIDITENARYITSLLAVLLPVAAFKSEMANTKIDFIGLPISALTIFIFVSILLGSAAYFYSICFLKESVKRYTFLIFVFNRLAKLALMLYISALTVPLLIVLVTFFRFLFINLSTFATLKMGYLPSTSNSVDLVSFLISITISFAFLLTSFDAIARKRIANALEETSWQLENLEMAQKKGTLKDSKEFFSYYLTITYLFKNRFEKAGIDVEGISPIILFLLAFKQNLISYTTLKNLQKAANVRNKLYHTSQKASETDVNFIKRLQSGVKAELENSSGAKISTFNNLKYEINNKGQIKEIQWDEL